jgi:hypothetical protein
VCRNIKTLFNFDPPVTDDEIRAASIQFVRKVSGSTKPSRVNQVAFDHAVDSISQDVRELLDSLVTSAPAKNRKVEAAELRARAAKRFGSFESR